MQQNLGRDKSLQVNGQALNVGTARQVVTS